MSVVHICTREAWSKARASSTYSAESLGGEGFIHFSRWDQLTSTAERHYAGVPDLLVVVVEPADLPFRVENGFPHLYGELPLSAVTEVLPLDEAIARVGDHGRRRTDRSR